MSIVAAFGDDDHTAADGPYARVLKVRKWLYIFSVASLILAYGLYDETAVHALLQRTIQLPTWLLAQATGLGLAYLVLQYAFLSYQLYRTYDLVLNERLAFRRQEELLKYATALNEAQSAVEKHHRSEVENAEDALTSATTNLSVANDDLERQRSGLSTSKNDSTEVFQIVPLPLDKPRLAFKVAQDRVRNALIKFEDAENRYNRLTGSVFDPHDPVSVSLYEALTRAQDAFNALRNQNPASRSGYKSAERLIDGMRILTPPIAAVFALVMLAQHAR